MRNAVKRLIESLGKGKKTYLMVLSCIVVFITTYALILPAVTLDKEEAARQGGIDLPQQSEQVQDEDVQVQDDQMQEDAFAEDSDAKAATPKSDLQSGSVSSSGKDDEVSMESEDAQASTHVITAKGKDFTIKVSYEDDARIPEKAVLEADEISHESDEFKDYLKQAKDAICDESNQDDAASDIGIEFARFFDIRIMAGGEKIEPAAPVQVSISYEDALNVDGAQNVCAVHFGDKGTEVIDTSLVPAP